MVSIPGKVFDQHNGHFTRSPAWLAYVHCSSFLESRAQTLHPSPPPKKQGFSPHFLQVVGGGSGHKTSSWSDYCLQSAFCLPHLSLVSTITNIQKVCWCAMLSCLYNNSHSSLSKVKTAPLKQQQLNYGFYRHSLDCCSSTIIDSTKSRIFFSHSKPNTNWQGNQDTTAV